MERTIFQCEDSTDGIFTGVYDAWASGLGHDNVGLQVKDNGNYELFARYVDTPPDAQKALKVARTLKKKMGEEEYGFIFQASLSKDSEKADPIYRMIVMALTGKHRGPLSQNLGNTYVCKVFELSRNVGNEAHRYLGFLRFRELKNQVLYAAIEPENQLLPLISEHFADRFPRENFIIYDKTHEMATIHEAGKQWGLVTGQVPDLDLMNENSEKEEEFRALWKGFCKSITIKERINPKLQQQFVPFKCRTHMVEF